MAELSAAGSFEGAALPLALGGAALGGLPAPSRASIAPFAGRREAVSAALAARTGAGLTEPGRAAGSVVWAGMGQWLLEGSDPAEVAAWLRGLAAVTDQSDGWAAMVLSGPAARAVLARLVPLDLDPTAFPAGAVARSMLRHVPLLLIAAATSFRLMVPRSYARTAVEDLAVAMAGVAARARLE